VGYPSIDAVCSFANWRDLLLKRLGIDIVAHLKLNLDEGNSLKLALEATGFSAFVLAQPIILLWIFVRLSREIAKILGNAVVEVAESFVGRPFI